MVRETAELALGVAYAVTAVLFFGVYTVVGDKVVTTVMNAKLDGKA
jgi:drug/metabolite transporter (DMT)-like permease